MSATRAINMAPRRSPGALAPSGSGSGASWVWFSAFALYGTLRWGTMLPGGDQGHMFLSLIVAVLCAGGMARLPPGQFRRWATVPLLLAGLLLEFAVAGFALSLHAGRLATHVGHGISGLSGVLVPYTGGDTSTVGVIVFGAGLLLLCAGAIFGSSREMPGTGRRALAALPMLALAVVPSAIVTPRLVYFHGLVTFVLGALFVFSSRLAPDRRGGAATLLAAAAVIGAIGAGLVAGDRVWLAVATGSRVVRGTGGGDERFNWQQTYAGIGAWPHGGATVLQVTAPRAAYWKAEDLDVFNGTSWGVGAGTAAGTAGGAVGDLGLTGISAAHLAAYTETVGVAVGEMSSQLVIAAGYASTPSVAGATPNVDAGTWITHTPLAAGETYQVQAYVPDPPAARLVRAGADYPTSVNQFGTLPTLPNAYTGVEALSRRLAAGTTTPYSYVEAVLAYLHRGYVYTLRPPAGGRYPLADFLLDSHRGYCQAFAGAMALLLRMHHIPARVAVGFSTGTREQDTDTYRVLDKDAHAWVEVWFPSYGWVTFDPTPGRAVAGTTGATPVATTGQVSTPTPTPTVSGPNLAASLAQAARARLDHLEHSEAGGAAARRDHHSDTATAIVLAILGVLTLGCAGVLTRLLWHRRSTAELTAELERAFTRCGRPLDSEVTFAALARRMTDNPAAAAYVAALGSSRYERDGRPPTAQGRTALRHWLAADLGMRGRLRALLALPPLPKLRLHGTAGRG